MKRVNKLAASVAVALSLGVVSQANAMIEMESDGRGDTLLFPVFNGYGENYVTISNSSGEFIQGHIRFRGAAWSSELLDFDVILTPGDVFVFRLADIDGDGEWEIDASLDPNNFRYTGMLTSCRSAEGISPVVVKENCIDPKFILRPTNIDDFIDPQITKHNDTVGYIEFIGEGVLGGMTHERLFSLINEDEKKEKEGLNGEGPGEMADRGQRRVGNRLGTSLWSWVDAYKAYPNNDGTIVGLFEDEDGDFEDRWAMDVPNALTGTAFITKTGDSYGVAYNAEALINFRTTPAVGGHTHRIDTYPRDNGVILHHENASLALAGNYSYLYEYDENGSPAGGALGNLYESGLSFNNTWGATLADGDDYKSSDGNGDFAWLAERRWTDGISKDSFDVKLRIYNSVAEVEEAIRKSVGGYPNPNSSRQVFTGFYFDDATFDKACEGNGRNDKPEIPCSKSTLKSGYFGFFPTKSYYGEEATGHWGAKDKKGYILEAIQLMLNWAKPFDVEIWDTFENTPVDPIASTCVVSPCPELPSLPTIEFPINFELAFFSIDDIKNAFGKTGPQQAWKAGRVVILPIDNTNMCLSEDIHSRTPPCLVTFPGLFYTLDIGSDNSYGHWRALQR